MKKKIFLTSACALLAVSGVWAEDVINNNITYTIGDKIESESIETSTSKDKFFKATNTWDGLATATLYTTRTTTRVEKPTYKVSIKSVESTQPVIAKFTANQYYGALPSEPVNINYTSSRQSSQYQYYGAELAKLDNQLWTLSQLKEAGIETVYQKSSTKETPFEISRYESNFASMYFYVEGFENFLGDFEVDKAYIITTINLTGTDTPFADQLTTYIPEEILEGNLFSNCSTVKIGVGVNSIENGAFSEASELYAFDVDNQNFAVDRATGFLYTKGYKTLIAAPAVESGTYILKSECTEVYSKVLDNCTGVTLMTSSESVANNTTLTGGKNNQIVYTNADLTCDANNVYSGFVYGNNLNKAIGTMVAGNSYNFRNTKVMEDINVDELDNKLPANVILFFAEGVTVSGTNIVKGTACTSLVLQDGTASYNNLMGRINADQITYTRTVNDTKWATLCVPFGWSLAANKSVWAGSLNGYEDNTITFIREPNPAAGVPLLMCNNSGNNLTEITSSGWVEMSSTINNGSKNGVGFNGIYNRFEVTTENNVFMYNASGSLNKAKSGNYCNPFRAYITYGGSASAPKIRFVDEFENEVDLGNTTGLVEMLNEEAESNIYNVKGQKVNNMTTPGVYVKNGKKVIVK